MHPHSSVLTDGVAARLSRDALDRGPVQEAVLRWMQRMLAVLRRPR